MKRGFTLLEVMISLVVMTIGAAGLFSLQGLIARSNLYSRHMTSATEVLETWTERLKADAIYWTESSPSATPALNLANTRYLQAIGDNAGTWIAPGTSTGAGTELGYSPAFDLAGVDLDPTITNNTNRVFYCAAYRLNWVMPGESLRAEVRVFWPREEMPAQFTTNFPLCIGSQANQDALSPGGAQAANYHVIYASTVLRWNPLP